ncbi:hypothetical protein [Subtercola sp. RTI3]|uniref:hypothetical protein n=1 Tax=Subtercola sp. RTI3 TaxID=3048639 RepID=UPI002B23B925|nr:hypothetical protein [Subtercola sp. RTI3]MEA9983691.1 hypothetical protein [Subtercola sp. RTI3]
MMHVLSTRTGKESMFYIIGNKSAEFVVQVVDRPSPIVKAYQRVTTIWAAAKLERSGGVGADAAFRAVACDSPLLRLPVASIDEAILAVAA